MESTHGFDLARAAEEESVPAFQVTVAAEGVDRYPEIAFVTATTINQTGQAVEGILLLMAVFLLISFCGSALMNHFNRRMAIAGR